MSSTAVRDPLTLIVALVALAVLLRTKVNSAWLIAGGVLVGLAHAAVA